MRFEAIVNHVRIIPSNRSISLQRGELGYSWAERKKESPLFLVLGGRGGRVHWRFPSYESVRRILKNPVYGGAYVYGRRQVDERLGAEQRPIKRVREQPDKNWHVLIEDHHAGYISW